MPLRAYIVPHIDEFVLEPGSQTLGCWHGFSEYFRDLSGVQYSRRWYGAEGVDLVVANLSSLDHSIVTANADVLAFPENLDTNPNAGARATAQTELENRGIPAGWITAGMSWRTILRNVFKIIVLMKYLNGRGYRIGRLLQGGVTLSTQFQNLPQATREKLVAFAEDHNWDTSGLSNTSTVRQILKFMADQITGTPSLGGMSI